MGAHAVVHESGRFAQEDRLDDAGPSERHTEVDRLLIPEPPTLPFRSPTRDPVTLLCLGPREHVLILMMHHIICDWSSEGVMWRELSALYRSLPTGVPLYRHCGPSW